MTITGHPRPFLIALAIAFALFSAAPAAFAQGSPTSDPDASVEEKEPEWALGVLGPNVSLSNIRVISAGETKEIDVPWIADLVSDLYPWAVGAGAVVAAAMMMIGGLQYITAGGNQQRVGAARKRITDALVGLLLTVGAYVILFTINPELVKFSGVRVKVVNRIPFNEGILQSELGTYDQDAPPPPDTPTSPGQYLSLMEAACGARDGLTLSMDQRIQRLRQIVNTWKTVGSDQGGAVYVRGGGMDCRYSNPSPDYALGSLVAAFLASPSNIELTGQCGDAVRTAAENNSQRSGLASSLGGTCRDQWKAEYDRLVLDRARDAGMLCGDCFSTLIHMFNRCFNRGGFYQERLVQYRPRPRGRGEDITCNSRGADLNDRRYVFALTNPAAAEVSAAARDLRFGDMLAWGRGDGVGHVFLYTGGQNLGYEIFEMGAGGAGDITSSGAQLAAQNAGIPYRVSGIRTHASADQYLTSLASRRNHQRGICIYAWRPLQD